MLSATNYLIATGANITKSDKTKFNPADFMLGAKAMPKDLSEIEDLGEFLNSIE